MSQKEPSSVQLITAAKAVRNADTSTKFYLTNNMSYAHSIEYGGRGQAKNGMLRINAAQWPQIVKRQINRLNKDTK